MRFGQDRSGLVRLKYLYIFKFFLVFKNHFQSFFDILKRSNLCKDNIFIIILKEYNHFKNGRLILTIPLFLGTRMSFIFIFFKRIMKK